MKRVFVALILVGAAIVFVVRRRPAAPPLSEAQKRAEANAIVSRLPSLDGYPFQVRYSASRRAEAVRLANLTRDAYVYFEATFPGTSPTLIATYLASADWPRGYGEPSYYPPDRRLRVATDDNAFWQSFGKIAHVASPFDAYRMLEKTYADETGTLRLGRFFDLVAVHELAHAFALQGGATFPTLWLNELYANLAMYAFIARTRPSELPYLTTLPEALTHITALNAAMCVGGYTSLDDFERHYPVANTKKPISGVNYGWYQVRLIRAAREMYEEGGEAALTRLWAFGKSEAGRHQNPEEYFREHGTIAGWSQGVHSKDLAKRLAVEVSPRLGQAIEDWH
jgi:hypothetical protein